MASTTQNLYQCRLCLKRTPTRVNIFGGDFPKMLEILTSIKVRENDGLPKYSCVQCALDVKSALTTKKRIIKAHKYLKETLQKQSIYKFNQKTTAQPQLREKTALRPPKIIISNESNKSSKTVATKHHKVVINASSSNSQNSEIINKDATSEVKIKIEVVDESDNSNDASTDADKNTGGCSSEMRARLSRKRTFKELAYTCKMCNISFSNQRAYSLHSKKHQKTKCDTCNKMIRSDNFKQHLLVHSSSGPAVCNLCGSSCKNVISLRSHMFYQHRNLNAYVCELCGTKFNSRYYFFLHKAKVHTGERNFKCETCGKTFFTKEYLMKHDKMTHKKLRPHMCEYCGTGFSSKNALRTHKRQHTNEKPYVCDHCSEGFRQRVSLRSHLKSKHGIEEAKEAICPECGRGFATNYALNIHQRLHKSMKCEVCSESFADQEYLSNHMKEAHSVKGDESQDTEENQGESEQD